MNIQNIDDKECFKWCLVKYLHPARITKADKKFAKEHKVKYPIYVPKKCCEDKHVDLLLIGGEGKKYYVLIK